MMIKKINIIKYGIKIFKIVGNGNGELNLHSDNPIVIYLPTK